MPYHLARTGLLSLLSTLLLLTAAPLFAEEKPAPAGVTPELRAESLRVMRDKLENEKLWAKVHAAEYLLALDCPDGVVQVFTEELDQSVDEPKYRIGIWRVLAQAAMADKQREAWINKIRDVFLDTDAPDRLHAVETLAKLGYKIPEEHEAIFDRAAAEGPTAPYARWVQLNSGREDGEGRLAELLESDDVNLRSAAGYALRWQKKIKPETWKRLAAATEREPADSAAKVHLLSAAFVHAPKDAASPLKAELLERGAKGTEADKVEMCHALAVRGDNDDLPLLKGLLQEGLADVPATAAYGISRIDRRVPRHMGVIDWLVIAGYALGMLAVGWYYARRTSTTEDYLLGGRAMKPWAVGLSMFATLLSTISYLAWPGETIKYGPMMLFGTIMSYPLIVLVVGWFIIPKIMKLRVTSAYEILEERLGLSVRMLGSTFFLSMRLLWMAVIIYATAGKVLVPMLGLGPSATPYVCAVMGIVTVIYTSMGGLRAVVFTDVVQTAILFGGAILAIVLITIDLGGVGAWWPNGWAPHWPEPVYFPDTEARATLFGVMLSVFIWYVCTQSSDQMAIQRYLATPDTKAARRVIIVSMIADGCVACFLAVLGLALLGYFHANPHLMADGQLIMGDADKLFSRFIIIGLPVGISGLVVAGLLAAAMSSLSSGINSSCSVITVDFIDRFRNRLGKQGETDHVRLAKYISVLVGAAVVVLSSYIGMVTGNLLEIAYKVVNLLTVPLAGLFFMALFVRWATSLGTIVGAVCGLAVVAAINYWETLTGEKGISFLFAMPLGLIVQMAVGMTVSLIPIGRGKELPRE